jgi:hypothetical protein
MWLWISSFRQHRQNNNETGVAAAAAAAAAACCYFSPFPPTNDECAKWDGGRRHPSSDVIRPKTENQKEPTIEICNDDYHPSPSMAMDHLGPEFFKK